MSSDPNLPVLGGVAEENGANEQGVEEVTTTFHHHDFMDYCLPDRENRLFRCVCVELNHCPMYSDIPLLWYTDIM